MRDVNVDQTGVGDSTTNSEIIYDIPAHLIGAFRGRRVVVRSDDPAEIAENVKPGWFEQFVGIRLLDITRDSRVLVRTFEDIPIEVALLRPANDFHLLYRHTRLLDSHPVRIRLAVSRGASRAARVASSLKYAVNLDVNQPDSEAIVELHSILEFYLHNSGASQPIEFFHSFLSACFNEISTNLWDVLEVNPASIRYVNDDGTEMMLRSQTGGSDVTTGLEYFVTQFAEELFRENAECCSCEFFNCCGGYFKWPLKTFRCSDIRLILAKLQSAATEVRSDLKEFASALSGGVC